MHLTNLFQQRLGEALANCPETSSDPSLQSFSSMVRATTDPKFGDYQVNCAMPLAKKLGKNPREIAASIVAALKIDDICEEPEIAGPGFINLKFRDAFIQDLTLALLNDDRCGVSNAEQPKRIVIDYSSPNVAKPMHVGHIRSTVIGDCLAKALKFLGHTVITDNHLGDWGTQFGMIIYGYKHFGDPEIVAENPVPELAKLYRKVHQLMGYHEAVASIPKVESEIDQLGQQHAMAIEEAESLEGKEAKKKRSQAESITKKRKAAEAKLKSAQKSVDAIDADEQLKQQADEHADIGQQVLNETSKLHSGDEENLKLWNEFLPHCKDEIDRVYDRLNVSFDHVLGESFYHPMLADVVDDLKERGMAKTSDGAICVFLDDFDAPMIVQKRDGAFLYATTDLATIRYRLKEFSPDEILYVVDSRQGEHFDKLFAVARSLDMDSIKFVHVNFGTVLGEDGKPLKTRSGDLIGLESLLNDAVSAAHDEVCNPERLIKLDPPMGYEEKRDVATKVGIGAIKYADLAHERSSDYRFNLKKMVALSGNTAAYAQYSFARTGGIMRTTGEDEASVAARVDAEGFELTHPAERVLALSLLKFEEALESVYNEYAPHYLVDYVFSLSNAFAKFNVQCHVKNAESRIAQTTRLALVVVTGRVIKNALEILGISVVKRM